MKLGRNDPCSCGSGKKYKNCCLGKAGLLNRKSSVPSLDNLNQLDSLFLSGRYAELENYAGSLIKLYPNSGVVWKLLGLSLQLQGKDALSAMQKAAELLPYDAEAHGNLAALLRARGQLDSAVVSCRHALKIKPDFAEVHNNLGVTLQDLGQLDEAVASYRLALKIKPDFAEAHNNLGSALKDLGYLDDAASSYLRAIEIRPNFTDALSNLLLILNYTNIHTPSHNLELARQYGRIVTGNVGTRFYDWQVEAQPERLRVGLVSGDLRNHVVGYFLEGLLTQIDSSRVELIAYPTNTIEDDLTARIRPYFSAWVPLIGKSDEAAARLIHADHVHVLIDLSGHTTHNRLPVFAWKPAPIQASWLGYFATTGVAEMDYLLADEVGVPEILKGQFTESIWYLPDTRLCFTAPSVDLAVKPLPALSNGRITFGCFQNLTKVGDEVLSAWGEIFAALPEASLRIQCKQLAEPIQRERLAEQLSHHGITSDRVSMHGAMKRDEYLASHAEIDLILDTFPYPGGTTTCEAMWMGVPTVTLAGNSLLARQGASILSAAGLGEWIATNKEDYISKAIAFAGDKSSLSSLRANLREQVLASPLFDASLFASNFEDALWGMWRAHS